MVGQCHDCHIPMPNYSGYIIVISSDNSMGEKYRAVKDASPYRCGGIILFLYQNVVTVEVFLRQANAVRPYCTLCRYLHSSFKKIFR